ncbi:MAG: Uma2 family endonuclease [Catenulisporales bacterium]|nr:Uma2 family endonuclease [Catenulisporales bacterium]
MTLSAEQVRPAWFTSTHTGPYSAEDLDRIPDLPPHTELIDGNLIFASPQALFHYLAMVAIKSALRCAAPSHLFMTRETPEPGVLVVDQAALGGIHQTGFQAAEAVLVVDAVSAESDPRDRELKANRYAAAGVRHVWFVDDVEDKTLIEVWKSNRDLGCPEKVGECDEFLDIEEPFPVTLDVWEINKFRRQPAPRGPGPRR